MKLSKRILAVTALCSIAAMTGCVYDDIDVCPTRRYVQIRYDKNLKSADAASSEVKSVNIYAADKDGTVVYVKTSSAAELSENGYQVNISDLPSGNYTLVAWAEGEQRNPDSYMPISVIPGKTHVNELKRIIKRNPSGEVEKDLTPLFHGMAENVDLTDFRTGGVRRAALSLTKNTSNVRIILQHLSGEPVDDKNFKFFITDDNGTTDWNNTLTVSDSVSYKAWSVSSGSAGIDKTALTRDVQTEIGVAMAELTVGRLVKGHRPILNVYNTHGVRVISIPLIDYALLIKGHYNSTMSDQEYLDRQDEYNLTFFLDKEDRWVSSSIIINSWRVILDDIDI